MKRRGISILLAAALLVGMTGGCRKKETSKETTDTVIESTTSAELAEEKESENDLNSDAETTEESTEETSGKDGTIELDPDAIIFTFEHTNMAWGFQSYVTLILGDGRIYTVSDYWNVRNDKVETINSIKRHVVQTEPVSFLDMEHLLDLYYAASKFDPNCTFTKESAACDMGSYKLNFWKEDGTIVTCMQYGDWRYVYDDPNAAIISKLWHEADLHITIGKRYQRFSMRVDASRMTTLHCGYVSLPDGSSGKYIFENYAEFAKAAEAWDLDLSQVVLWDGDNEKLKDYPIFVQFDLFDTLGHERDYDAFLIADDTYRFLRSENCKDPAPDESVAEAMDGFVSIYLYTTKIDWDKDVLQTEDGGTWEKYAG